ncbi:gephyrin-like molybdotransferase Glp [Geotalea sp. SG265]|uniref:molybdopterin molybdotransferase MoeA n=1 Tax=Geotalea sp. SG265 TaxID=2922867 RepID=UPI001FAFFAA0|nr:gephyrin-like molybdotransferase Glp [Geotalea sp. SG265]
MPTFSEARRTILDHVSTTGIERVSLIDAIGRTLAEDMTAPWNMPPWDNSAMDGFAVRAGDCQAPQTLLKVTGYIPAGAIATSAVEAGCAIRIMTGAPIPPGADAVVPVEETEEDADSVKILEPVKARQHIRFAGEDIKTGDRVLAAGTAITPSAINMLASLGTALLPVFRRVRVAIVSTGDELVELGGQIGKGQIINSNALSLAAAVKEIGGEPVIVGIARDNRESHLHILQQGLQADVLITSAGVSAGDRDLVREILTELGAEQLFWKVDIKPGRPTAFAMKANTPIFSLPGNPVSSMITFEELVKPALLKMMGRKQVIAPLFKATLTEEIRKKPGRLHFLRVALERGKDGYLASSSGNQETGIVKTMIQADGLAMLPPDKALFAAGEQVDVHILNQDFLLEEA